MNPEVLGHLLQALQTLLGQRSTQAGIAALVAALYPGVLPADFASHYASIIEVIGVLLVLFPAQNADGSTLGSSVLGALVPTQAAKLTVLDPTQK